MADAGIVFGMVLAQVLQHRVHCRVHHPVVEADVFLDRLDLVSLALPFAQFVGAGRRWAEVVVQRLATPGGLDQQDGRIELRGERESKTEFWTNLVGAATVADAQWTGPSIAVSDRSDVDPLGNCEGRLDLRGHRIVLGL